MNTAKLPQRITTKTASPTSESFDFKTLDEAIIAVRPQIDVPIASNFDNSFCAGHIFERAKYANKINEIVTTMITIDGILTLVSCVKLIFKPSKIIANRRISFFIKSRPLSVFSENLIMLKNNIPKTRQSKLNGKIDKFKI